MKYTDNKDKMQIFEATRLMDLIRSGTWRGVLQGSQ